MNIFNEINNDKISTNNHTFNLILRNSSTQATDSDFMYYYFGYCYEWKEGRREG